MNKTTKKIVRHIAKICGYYNNKEFPSDFSEDEIKIINSVQPYTMTGPERIFSLIQSVRYVTNYKIPGDIVECGVWKGGSMMAIAKTLLEQNNQEKQLYLFDTFEGMSKPEKIDVSINKIPAIDYFNKLKTEIYSSDWCLSPIDEVKSNLFSTNYDKSKIHFIKGNVETTLPMNEPKSISILRLDTDWYQSTKHELIHLFPKLSKGGVLIIDDYRHWKGVKKAVDEHIKENKIQILLNRIDGSTCVGIKL